MDYLLGWALRTFPEPNGEDRNNNNWVELPADVDPATYEYEYKYEQGDYSAQICNTMTSRTINLCGTILSIFILITILTAAGLLALPFLLADSLCHNNSA